MKLYDKNQNKNQKLAKKFINELIKVLKVAKNYTFHDKFYIDDIYYYVKSAFDVLRDKYESNR